MGPRCDWVCLSPKCRQDGASTVYNDLPVNTTRCPVCGSKRITRLYNSAPGILRSGSRDLQRVIDDAGSQAQAKQDGLRQAERTLAKAHREIQGPKPPAPMFAVPMKQLGAALKSYGLSTTVNSGMLNSNVGARPMAQPSEAIIREMARGGVKTQIALRDKARIENGAVVE